MQTLLKKLNSLHIKLNLLGEKLDINAPKGVMTQELLEEIKLKKDEIIDFLKRSQGINSVYKNIPNVSQQESYIISSAQKRLWLLSQQESHNAAYNISSVFEFKGGLDIAILENVFQKLFQRHESLRTVFVETADAEIRQIVLDYGDLNFKIQVVDATKGISDEDLKDVIDNETKHPFDLAKDCLMRVKLIQKAEDTFIFILTIHHIVSDGWSMEVMINELFILYNAFLNNIDNPLPPLPIQYKDYASWQQDQIKEDNSQLHKAYWLKQFQGDITRLDLPKKQVLSNEDFLDKNSINRNFDATLLEKFTALCKSQDSTLFMGLVSVLNVLFYKYTNQKDIIIGSPIAGREHSDLLNQIGFYVNTLALRTQFEEKNSFTDLLSNVRNVTLGAYEHQIYPFDELIENLNIRREPNKTPLFDVLFTLQNIDNFEKNSQQVAGINILDFNNQEKVLTKFDMELTFTESVNGLNFILTFNNAVYSYDFAEKLVGHFGTIMESVLTESHLPILNTRYLSQNEIKQVIVDFNNTEADFPKDKTIVDLFEAQVEKTPNNIAVAFEKTELTYSELNAKTNQLGVYLREKYNIVPDDFVGIRLERSEKMIIALLGILKSGAAYVPIDSSYPQERIDFIEKDSNCKIVIDQAFLEEFNSIQKNYAISNPVKISQPNHLAYVIYTSGTTGNPKGVMVEHVNVANLINSQTKQFKVTEDENILQFSNTSFDASVEQIFLALFNGASLHIPNKNTIIDAEKLTAFIEENKITHCHAVPSVLEKIEPGKSPFLKRMIAGGDICSPELANKWSKYCDFYNEYGPTETTVTSIEFLYNENKPFSIGRPIDNTQVYLLDNHLQPVSVGVVGKMYVAGAGVTRGYLNRPELTTEKFVNNPFVSGTKMYDTGDLGRWLPDGNIEFLGRNDHQVKIRGFRIELGEIEASLLQFSEAIKQVVVEAKVVNGEKVLVAYYIVASEIDKSEIRSYLQSKLPEYMVPAFYVALEKMPVTPNGKVDRKVLPGISGEDIIRKEYVAPRNEDEQKIVAIWQEVLGIDKVGITDNFFELGGHSLIVGQIINRLNKQLGKKVTFKDFFANATIESLSKVLNQGEYVAIPKAPVMDNYPLTGSQHRLWVLSQFESGSLAYNMPSAIKLMGSLDKAKFNETLNLLIQRHEILRTSFKNDNDGQVRQYITPIDQINFNVAEIDFTGHNNQNLAISDYLEVQNNIAFNLEQAPLIRASLIKLKEDEYVFFLSMHHIIGDGWSMELIVSEVVKIYNAIIENQPVDLPELNIQYKDYSVWINEKGQQEELQKSKEYWVNQFAGELPTIELPSFKKRPLVQTFNGDYKLHRFSTGFSEKLKAFSKEHDATLFMVLMAGIKTLLHRYSNQDDIIIGTPIAGREHPDLENQIGLYLNTLAIRTQFEEGEGFLEILKKEKETLLNGYQHQNYPFDELVGNLNLKRDLSRSTLFDVVVVLQNQAQLNNLSDNTNLKGLQAELFDFDSNTSKFDLTFTFFETQQLELNITYNTDIYDSLFIDSIFSHIENVFDQVISNPKQSVDALDYLSTEEKTKLVVDFNDTAIDYPSDKTVVELLEEQVENAPNSIAVAFEEVELTYEEFNKRANQLGHYLREKYNIVPDDLIGIKLDRSDRMIVAIFGILKSGAAYVPIDLSYPQERIDYIEKDSNCKLVIDEAVLEEFDQVKETYSSANPEKINQPQDIGYIMYTSGTTGNPKGVMVEQGNIIRLVKPGFSLPLNTESILLSTGSISFDATTIEYFGTLLNGAKLILVKQDVQLNLDRLAEVIQANNVNSIFMTASWFNQVVENKISLFATIKRMMVGGDVVSPIHVQKLFDHYPSVKIVNGYGPTENTTLSTSYEIELKEYNSIPIGKPVSNSQVYILDKTLQTTSIGVIGKLYVSGAGVARGYLNKPELTAEKFINNPFIPGTKMYDTGDLGRWLPDGTIEFFGRKDNQVKIRGFRIELGEIETVVLQFSDAIKETVVEAKEVNGEKVLVAYYAADSELEKTEIRNYLQGKLPEYMMPTFFVAMESLPLTSNGKIDRKALPSISGEDIIRREYVAPRNDDEQKMTIIWQEVLGIEEVGVTDNFFELGGHSLVVAQVINRLNKELNKTVSFKDFFSNPTIASLVEVLSQEVYIAIPQVSAMDNYPLSGSQYRFWILSQLENGSLAYNMPSAIKLKGTLDKAKFSETFKLLIERHEILRTSFKNDEEGQIRQFIASIDDINFEVSEMDFTNHSNQKVAVVQYLEEQNNQAFNLEQAPLLRASLVKLNEDEYVFFLSMHHIIGDGWSMELIVSEVVKIYNAIIQNQPVDLPKLNIQYKDYSVWMNDKMQQKEYQNAKGYWLNQFAGELPTIELPAFKKRPLVQTFNGSYKLHQFSGEFLGKVKTFSKEHDLTLFMTLMTGVKTLLHKYTNQNDIIVGTPIAGREHPDLENQIGLYLNTLAIRTKFEQGEDFLKILNKEKETLLNAYQHQDYPFDELVANLNLKRDLSRSALFDVMVVLQNQTQLNNVSNHTDLVGLQAELFDFENNTSKLDLNFTFVEADQLYLTVTYNTDIYDALFIDSVVNHLENVFTEIIRDPKQSLDRLDYLSSEEKTKLVVGFNSTEADYPKGKTILDLFEEQVEKTPDNVAVVFEETKLTYAELNAKTNQLGRYLRAKYAIVPDALVGIKLDRSEKMIVALLGILKSGAAYVPIDPSYPQERINYIEKDSDCKLVIDEVLLNEFKSIQGEYPASNPERICQPNHLAYVIYTSGTTGNPKGVMVEHTNVINLTKSQTKQFGIDDSERILQLSNFSFDASVEQTFLALLNGGSLYILPRKVLLDQNELELYVSGNKITHFHSVPSVVSKLKPSDNYSLRRVLSGGDICPEKLAASWSPFCDFYNKYGPTETTVTSIEFLYDENMPFSIGRPINNTQIYVLNSNLQPVSVGVIGKMYISGAGVTRGYLNRPELTAEKFINNPFVSGTKMYDTGDVARWLPNGTIEFLGRNDHQVKIRGFRIELGEIETSLLQFSNAIKHAVVDAKEVNGEKVLVAYYTAGSEIEKLEIRSYLQSKLPEHMVPAFYVALENMPLTPNGKIDRKALPGISGEDIIRKEYAAPRNQDEQKIVEIWQEVLGVEKVGITDNFFELGGHSLMVAQIINRLNKQLNKKVTFKDFFSNPTIESLGQVLNQGEYVAIPQAPEMISYPLTGSQYRLWVLSQLENGSLAYNMPSVIKLVGTLDKAKFNETLNLLIQRHEILRTGFVSDSEDQVRQYIKPIDEINFAVTEINFTNHSNQKLAVLEYLEKQNSQAFNLEQAPLVRASLIELKEDEHVFFLTMHHIIGDGWSMQLIVDEIVKIYNAIVENKPVNLPELSIQYKDYSVWINEKMQQEEYLKAKEYWLNQFSGELPVTELPAFKKRPLVQTYNGNDRSHQFSGEFLEKLKVFSKEQDVTLFMILMAGIKILLHRYSGQNDIIVGTPIAGREHPDLENQIGLYLNTLAIRTQFGEGDDLLEVVNKEKEALLNAYQHQNYPFDELVGNLNLKRDLSRSALFDVMVILQNQGQLNNLGSNANLTGLQAESFDFENKTAKFDLNFTFVEGDQLYLTVTYNTDIYDSSFINLIFSHLDNVYSALIDNPKQPVDSFDYLAIEEKTKFVEEFNNTQAEYPQGKTMIDLFEEQVEKTPDAIAVIFEELQLTYRELNEQANQLGHYLRENHIIKAEDLIGIKLERSEKMIVTLLGILKSGAAYVPIDLSYPQERIEYIEKDSNCKIVIDESVFGLFHNIQDEYLKSNPERINTVNDLAYIIYTSGTTGNPKGVMIEHRNAVELIHWSIAEFDTTKFDTVYAVTSYCFDLSVFEIFYTFSTGKKIKLLKNGLELKNHIGKDRNALINTVPSVVSQLLDDGVSFESVGILNMAGEPIPHSIVQRLPLDKLEVYNLYGPSEDTTYSTYFKIRQKEYVTIPVGKPISNSQVYILDPKLQIVSTGVFGKIFVAGAGVTRGYLNKPELTAEKFMANPFISGTTMYDTGDLGRWLPDGTIEFLGRNDHQVKIRGFRIELGEIETRLLQFSDAIKHVVVEAKDVNGEKVIVAYFTADSEIEKAEIKNYLQSKLPEYMVPTFYVALENMPLTPNGKIDRKALPGISDDDVIRNEYVVPRNEGEQQIAGVWQEVLGIERVGITDNFFDLGGNSITAINLVTKMNKSFGTAYPLDLLFHYNSISELAKFHTNAIMDSDYYEYGNKNDNQNVVFAFPPISGYGSAYTELFQNINTCKFVSFNFIENKENLIGYYAEKINEIQKEGDIVLFGWSAGGVISYEVANYLTHKLGRNVSKLIMFDTIIFNKEDLTEDLLLELHDPEMENDESMREVLLKAEQKQKSYIEYLRNVSYEDQLPVELDLLRVKSDEYRNWEAYFEKVNYLTGQGEHHKMLEGDNLVYNKGVLCELLEKVHDSELIAQ
ncbi:amino acid adenylation domain-containing protein [Flavobacterium amniphilum]|uniref:non-ribosomal peptide synthetase n=1 Tax=Flavobacterium amniphilum TaxID=1834035 RepID=UPI00202A04C0|nr:non-ribosomal peptide synthetase [Flavobacterium amniphilum]MCL9807005.1 amino acid adenylation domain-containing protein [Flavobacterium amniphilum]